METTVPTQVEGGAAEGEGPAASSAPAQSPQSTPDVKELLKTHREKLKINGKERELSYDEILKRAQIQEAADEKFKTAKQKEEEANSLLQELRSKPTKALERLGFSKAEIKTLLENDLVEIIEEESLSPEEKATRERDRKLKEYEEREKTQKQKEDEERQNQERHKEMARIENDLVEAAIKVGLPKNALFAKWTAQKLLNASLNDIPISAEDAASEVLSEFKDVLSEIFDGLEPQSIESLLGKGVFSKIREHSVKAVKESNEPFVKPRATSQAKPNESQDSGKKEKIPAPQFFHNLRFGNNK